jgi:EAL domain-containing protein (putative c-di-GMP-specific phosphodiesterase class I)
MIPPSRFIPLAEESTLIVTLGERVLLEACRQAKAWQDAGLMGACVSVNLAPRQFMVGDIVETVARALQTTGLDPDRLELEITESSIMYAVEHMTALMHRLKQLGVSVETAAQASFLRQHHCDEIQGFLVAPPVPADQIQSMLGRPGRFDWAAQHGPH